MDKRADVEISVIIPTHNNEASIGRAIESIFSQVFCLPYEVIVVADRCTDKTEDVVRELMEKHSNLYLYPSDCGSGNLARIAGIQKAQGKYIMFLDGDDYYHEDALSKMRNTLVEKDADIVNCNLFYLHSQKAEKSILKSSKEYDRDHAMAALFRDLSFKGFLYTKIYKAEILKGLDLSLPRRNNLYEDGLLVFFYLTKIKKAVTIPDALVYYDKTNESSLTTSPNQRVQDHVDVRAKMREILDKEGNEKALKLFRFWKLRPYTLLFVDLRLSRIESKEEKKSIKKKAKADMRKIFSKKPLEKEGQSYSAYLKEVSYR